MSQNAEDKRVGCDRTASREADRIELGLFQEEKWNIW